MVVETTVGVEVGDGDGVEQPLTRSKIKRQPVRNLRFTIRNLLQTMPNAKQAVTPMGVRAAIRTGLQPEYSQILIASNMKYFPGIMR
jgi:hypothetical protein